MIGGEKRDMWWLPTTLYIKQFNENLPPKEHIDMIGGKKRYVVVSRSLIHQTIQ